MSVERRRQLIDPGHLGLSIVRQCELVSVSRSTFYREPAPETALNLMLMRLVDEQFLETPWYGSRQMARYLRRQGHTVGRERVRRLMAKMGLAAIYQRPRTTIPHLAHRIYPYLLRDLVIDQRPAIFNSDQGSQFTSPRFTEVLIAAGARISMDGRGRWMDNVFIERLWRSLKYECVYLHAFETGSELRAGLTWWIDYYNSRRPHSGLNGRTPDEAYGAIGTRADDETRLAA